MSYGWTASLRSDLEYLEIKSQTNILYIRCTNDNEYLDDQMYEIALQKPIIQGDISVDIQEEDRMVCVPVAIIESIYCRIHMKFKYNFGIALASFHKYPSVISWRIGRKYAGENAFEKQCNYKGLTFYFYCANSKDSCIAEKVWKSTGLQIHNNEHHVVFEESFKPFELKEGATLNRHIHPQGTSISKYRDPTKTEPCCKVSLDDLPEIYRHIPSELIGATDTQVESNNNPIHSYMKEVVEGYKENPVAIQLGRRITYSKKKI